jgi:Fe-S cluster assembly protein SufD
MPALTNTPRTSEVEIAQKMPIPDRKLEDWRFLDPGKFPWREFEEAAQRNYHETGVQSQVESSVALPKMNAAELSRILSIHEADGDIKFLHLHRTLANNDTAYRIPKTMHNGAIRIVQRISCPAAPMIVLHVESGADAVVYHRWESETNGAIPIIGRIEIVMEPDTKLHFLHEDQLSASSPLYYRAHAKLPENAHLDWGVCTSGSVWHAAKMTIDLQGVGAESTTYGLFCGAGERAAEHRTVQNHVSPHAKSNLVFKSLLAGKSRSVYQGMIRVEKAAQRTDAFQASRNLILSSAAHAEAIPRLEILADDVRCSHGATVGTVNANTLFYLMTRGLSRPQAVAMIAEGFAEEIIRRVPLEDIAERWRKAVKQTIGDHLI